MCPLLAITSDESLIASVKSPVISVSAARNRLPKLCPPSSPSPRKRWRNRREIKFASSESAIMQLRMSPGGSICNSSRNRPELPPSSETVTMAERLSIHMSCSVLPTNCFSPASSVERPVPPPIVTSFCKLSSPANTDQSQFILPCWFEKPLGRITEDQTIEVRIISQGVKIVIVLGAHTKVGLNRQRALQRFEGKIDRAEPGASGGQTVVNVCGFRFAFECSLKHLLSSDIFTAIQFDDAAVVKRIGVAGQHAFRAQSRLRNREIGARTGGDFRDLRILIDENSKLIPRFGKTSTYKLFVSTFESAQRGRLVHRRLSRSR